MTKTDERFYAAIPAALRIVGAVRDRSPEAVAAALRGIDTAAVIVALASLVDDSHEVSELLQWTSFGLTPPTGCAISDDHSSPGTTAVHGTRSRYTAGCRGQACRDAESTYQHARYQRRKAQASEIREAA